MTRPLQPPKTDAVKAPQAPRVIEMTEVTPTTVLNTNPVVVKCARCSAPWAVLHHREATRWMVSYFSKVGARERDAIRQRAQGHPMLVSVSPWQLSARRPQQLADRLNFRCQACSAAAEVAGSEVVALAETADWGRQPPSNRHGVGVNNRWRQRAGRVIYVTSTGDLRLRKPGASHRDEAIPRLGAVRRPRSVDRQVDRLTDRLTGEQQPIGADNNRQTTPSEQG